MSAASDYIEDMIINALLRGGAFTEPTDIFVALHTAQPDDETGSNEVSTLVWPDYERVDSAQGDTLANAWSEPENGESQNLKQMLFPVYNGVSNLTVTHFSLWDAKTGGNFLMWAPLSTPSMIVTGQVYVIEPEKLTIRVL